MVGRLERSALDASLLIMPRWRLPPPPIDALVFHRCGFPGTVSVSKPHARTPAAVGFGRRGVSLALCYLLGRFDSAGHRSRRVVEPRPSTFAAVINGGGTYLRDVNAPAYYFFSWQERVDGLDTNLSRLSQFMESAQQQVHSGLVRWHVAIELTVRPPLLSL